MFKKYLWAGICILALGIGNVVNAADMEAVLESNTSATGFSVKDNNNNTLMRVQGDGNVGFGTTAPTGKFHISTTGQSNSFLIDSTTGYIGIGTTPTFNKTLIVRGEGIQSVYAGENLIGGTPLLVGASDAEMFTIFTSSSATGNGGSIIVNRDNVDIDFIVESDISPDAFVVRGSDGNVGIGTTAPTEKLDVAGNINASGAVTQGSSRTIKDKITRISSKQAMRAFEQLEPVSFIYKDDSSREKRLGFIAEDVPEMVATQDRKHLNTMDLTAVLTKVVQEQQRTISSMSEEIETLKASVNLLLESKI